MLSVTSDGQEIAAASTPATNGIDLLQTTTTIQRLAAGDVIAMQAGQNSGGALNTSPFYGRGAVRGVGRTLVFVCRNPRSVALRTPEDVEFEGVPGVFSGGAQQVTMELRVDGR